jgi:hypothetical protein
MVLVVNPINDDQRGEEEEGGGDKVSHNFVKSQRSKVRPLTFDL